MIHRERIEGLAAKSGFRKDSVEKVVRLCGILRRLDSHPTTAGQWLLKGGTALNLLHLDVPRMSVDIDLNYIGAGGRDAMAAARPGFEAALVSVCEREGCAVRRTPGEHAGGKFRLRFVSVFGGSQNLEIDASYVARVPLFGSDRLATRFPPDEPVEVATLSFKELAAGKFCALMQRSVPRDAFDAVNLLDLMPGLLDDAEFRVAFVCAMAGGRQDPRMLPPRDPAPTVLDIRQQLLPMLRQVPSAAPDAESLQHSLCARLAGVADRLLQWSPAQRVFLDHLHDNGRVDATDLHPEPEIRRRIEAQPMLLWKAKNVRAHRAPRRLDELRQLKDGWLEGAGLAPHGDHLDWFASAFARHYPVELPFPRIYPTESGDLLVEWSLGNDEVSLEISLSTRRARWHALARDGASESALSLDLATDSAWAELIRNITDKCRESD